jgi:protein dithiol oxidoreductase (disulfide-forming)
MNRGIVIASVLAAAAAIAAFSMRGEAATTPGSQWQPGLNYTVLGYPQPSTLPKGKVEVNEVFWYGCSHCYALDPVLESWKGTKPAYIEFVRIPVIWGPSHRQHARLFYTLQKLGRDDLHPKVFAAIHQGGKPLMASTDQEARAMHLSFLKENGVSEKQFNDTYDSPEVTKQVDLAEELTVRYEVASVPTMIVAGSYSTSVSQAGGENQLLALINDLAAREQRR